MVSTHQGTFAVQSFPIATFIPNLQVCNMNCKLGDLVLCMPADSKCACDWLHTRMQKWRNCIAKPPNLKSKTAEFAAQNRRICSTVKHKRQNHSRLTPIIFGILLLMKTIRIMLCAKSLRIYLPRNIYLFSTFAVFTVPSAMRVLFIRIPFVAAFALRPCMS